MLALMTSFGKGLLRSFAHLLISLFAVFGASVWFCMCSWKPFYMDIVALGGWTQLPATPSSCQNLSLETGMERCLITTLVRFHRHSQELTSWCISCYFRYQLLKCLQSMLSSSKWSNELEKDYHLLLTRQEKRSKINLKVEEIREKASQTGSWTVNFQLSVEMQARQPKGQWLGFLWHCKKQSTQELLSHRGNQKPWKVETAYVQQQQHENQFRVFLTTNFISCSPYGWSHSNPVQTRKKSGWDLGWLICQQMFTSCQM